MRRLLNNPINNVVATGRATQAIGSQENLLGLEYTLGGTTFTRAHIRRYKLTVLAAAVAAGAVSTSAAKTIIDMTEESGGLSGAERLEKINVYLGHATAAAYLRVPFYERNAKDIAGEYAGILDLGNTGGLHVEMDIVGATLPTMESVRFADNAASRPIDQGITGLLPVGINFVGARRHFLPLPSGANSAWILSRLFLFASAVRTKISLIELERNGPIPPRIRAPAGYNP